MEQRTENGAGRPDGRSGGKTADGSDDGRYAAAFRRWSGRAERRLKRAVIWLAVLLVCAQLALQIPAVRQWATSAGRAEGFEYVDRTE